MILCPPPTPACRSPTTLTWSATQTASYIFKMAELSSEIVWTACIAHFPPFFTSHVPPFRHFPPFVTSHVPPFRLRCVENESPHALNEDAYVCALVLTRQCNGNMLMIFILSNSLSLLLVPGIFPI